MRCCAAHTSCCSAGQTGDCFLKRWTKTFSASTVRIALSCSVGLRAAVRARLGSAFAGFEKSSRAEVLATGQDLDEIEVCQDLFRQSSFAGQV